jgi:hypothetical protein
MVKYEFFYLYAKIRAVISDISENQTQKTRKAVLHGIE